MGTTINGSSGAQHAQGATQVKTETIHGSTCDITIPEQSGKIVGLIARGICGEHAINAYMRSDGDTDSALHRLCISMEMDALNTMSDDDAAMAKEQAIQTFSTLKGVHFSDAKAFVHSLKRALLSTIAVDLRAKGLAMPRQQPTPIRPQQPQVQYNEPARAEAGQHPASMETVNALRLGQFNGLFNDVSKYRAQHMKETLLNQPKYLDAGNYADEPSKEAVSILRAGIAFYDNAIATTNKQKEHLDYTKQTYGSQVKEVERQVDSLRADKEAFITAAATLLDRATQKEEHGSGYKNVQYLSKAIPTLLQKGNYVDADYETLAYNAQILSAQGKTQKSQEEISMIWDMLQSPALAAYQDIKETLAERRAANDEQYETVSQTLIDATNRYDTAVQKLEAYRTTHPQSIGSNDPRERDLNMMARITKQQLDDVCMRSMRSDRETMDERKRLDKQEAILPYIETIRTALHYSITE